MKELNKQEAFAQSLKKIDSINEVEGFCPALHIKTYDEGTIHERKSIAVKTQMAWFLMKYPNARIKTDPVKFSANGAVMAKAEIYLERNDEKPTAEAMECRLPTDTVPSPLHIGWAQTAALGRALTYLGFGLQAGFSDDELNSITNFSGASEAPLFEETDAKSAPEEIEVIEEEQPAKAKAQKKKAEAQQIGLTSMSIEDAMNTVCELRGKHKGVLMGHIAQEDPDYVKWLESDEFQATPNTRLVKEAAVTLVRGANAI